MKKDKSEKLLEELIVNRQAPAGLNVSRLDFSDSEKLVALPENLQATSLILNGCRNLTELPKGLQCYHLQMHNTPIRSLPPDIQVTYKLELRDCKSLTSLPKGLTVGCLDVSGCTALTTLPEGLQVNYLNLSNCTAFAHWPEKAQVNCGRLSLRRCRQVATLPDGLTNLAQLDLSDCEHITDLPEGLQISSWLDLANTRVQSLPPTLADVQLRWRGVPITHRIAFQPETITATEILNERNVELRRVLLERCGYERFLKEAGAEIVHQDSDPGGNRRLFRVQMERDEDLVCVSVQCPSTGRQYLIRVPPKTKTCHQAASWIAGFDDPAQYAPLIET